MRRKLTICLGTAILGLLLAEGTVRILGLRVAPQPITRGALCRPSKDPELGHVPRPGARQLIEYPSDGEEAGWSLEQGFNLQGFRGPAVQAAKPPGVRRIACLGDSHTFGYGVAAERAWPAQLGLLLEQRAPGRFEVINAGVPNYDTARAVRWLETRVAELDPDMALLQYFVNDSLPRESEESPIDRNRLVLNWTSPSRKGWVRELRDRSRLADLCLDGAWRWVIHRELSSGEWEVRSPEHPGWMRVRDALLHARSFAAERDIALGVALFPLMVRQGDRFASHAAFVQVKELCAREGIPCHDAEPALLGCERLTVSRADLHASGEAHAAFAESVLQWLERLGWIAP